MDGVGETWLPLVVVDKEENAICNGDGDNDSGVSGDGGDQLNNLEEAIYTEYGWRSWKEITQQLVD